MGNEHPQEEMGEYGSLDDPKGMYLPKVILFKVDTIMACLKDNGIMIEKKMLKNIPSSFLSYLTVIMTSTAKSRPEYTKVPNRAPVEHDDEYKMRNEADPPLRPFENVCDHLYMMLWKVDRDIKYRGGEVIELFFC